MYSDNNNNTVQSPITYYGTREERSQTTQLVVHIERYTKQKPSAVQEEKALSGTRRESLKQYTYTKKPSIGTSIAVQIELIRSVLYQHSKKRP